MITVEEKKQIKEKGYADIGGIQRKRYWTPDGREILSIPAIRTYVKMQNGKVVENGIRDANLDNGWLESKPDKLKPYCPYCGKWHNTQVQINECGKIKKKLQKKFDLIAEAERSKEQDLKTEVDNLKSDVSEIKEMLHQLLAKE